MLVFHDYYPEGKQGGLEIIQHGERIATNGDLRLEPAPGQWARLSRTGERHADAENGIIRVSLSYSEQGLDYTIRVEAAGESLLVFVDLDHPLGQELEGKVSLNLELFPEAYFGKTYHLGNTFGIFPRQANGPMKADPEGGLVPCPLATGSKLTIAPEEPERLMTIEHVDGGEIQLLDGRNAAQNGWFIVRSIVSQNTTKAAVTWRITANSIPDWRRKPVIGISQAGYHPDQEKRAVIELDARTEELSEVVLLRVDPQKGLDRIHSSLPEEWGKFLRYKYAIFDFTQIRDPGMYLIQYESEYTPPFRISKDVYQEGIWQPTLETYFPAQMCHVEVRDRYRVWHGACHLDDALQAPPEHTHFDGYRQGLTTETSYSADEHIPFLDKGGWHDAGDYDLAAGSQAQTTFVLALIREEFGLDSDQTTVNKDERLVLLHTPDGVPDIVQQVAHGAENLLSGYRATGHSFSGIISRRLDQYVHVGDGSVMTDNRVYDSSLAPGEIIGEKSGRVDDRWAFTNRDTALEYKVITALAAASRALKGYEDSLAKECLDTAVRAWEYEQTHPPARQPGGYVPRDPKIQEIFATVELLITTGENRYREHLLKLLPRITGNIERVAWTVTRVIPCMEDDNFKSRVKEAVEGVQPKLEEETAKNPYGIPFRPRIWGIGWDILRYAKEQYYLIKAYPELFNRENLLAAVNYILGCHPGSNVSLVSGVGARSLTVAYGTNRADWSYIPGGVVSGTGLIRPDFPELKDNFPFLWQQAENVIGGSATYIFCILAADKLLNQANS